MPETKRIHKTDTAQFFPKDLLPTVSIATQIAASMDTIEQALQMPTPAHTEIRDYVEQDRIDIVINKLHKMYTGENSEYKNTSTKSTRLTTATPK